MRRTPARLGELHGRTGAITTTALSRRRLRLDLFRLAAAPVGPLPWLDWPPGRRPEITSEPDWNRTTIGGTRSAPTSLRLWRPDDRVRTN